MAPLVLLTTDRPGWCFENIAKALSKELSQFYQFKIMPSTKTASEDCDILVSLCWEMTLRVKANVRAKAIIACLYDHLSWSINEDAFAHLRLVLKNVSILSACNQTMFDLLKEKIKNHSELPTLALLEDGVDLEMFPYCKPPDKFACGWTGMSTRHTPGGPADLKGMALMKEACAIAGAELRVLDASGGGAWPHSRMPLFYENVTCELIGSVYEGTPNPLLESMAMGRIPISTKVGLAPKLIEDGKSGFLVDGNAQAMARAIQIVQSLTRTDLIKMGERAHEAVQRQSWKNMSRPWKDALDKAMLGHEVLRARSNLAPIEVISAMSTAAQAGGEPVVISPSPGPLSYRGGKQRRVLLVSDVPGWAFHTNLMDLERYLKDEYLFEHWFVVDLHDRTKSIPDMDRFDAVFIPYHRWNISGLLPWDRTLGSLRAQWFFPEDQHPPGPREFELVNRFRGFHLVTRENFSALKPHCPNAVYLTNPVNMTRFPSMTPIENEVIVEWNGNAKHNSGKLDVKGFRSYVIPSCEAAGVHLEYAEYNTRRIPHNDMPAFYHRANVALCASLYEGASNSAMEAMASGLALITTNVGNAAEMVESQLKAFDDTGIVTVERSITAIAEALATLKKDPARVRVMGEMNREEITKRWSWGAWKDRYSDFLKMAWS